MNTPTQSPDEPADRRPIACLGEAIVDLICERNLDRGEAPDSFVPRPGGALANVAVAVSRCGTPAALVGGVGDDALGAMAAPEALKQEGVSVRWLATLDGADTPVGPDRVRPGQRTLASRSTASTSARPWPRPPVFSRPRSANPQALIVGSNTMVGEAEREVTRSAVEIAAGARSAAPASTRTTGPTAGPARRPRGISAASWPRRPRWSSATGPKPN